MYKRFRISFCYILILFVMLTFLPFALADDTGTPETLGNFVTDNATGWKNTRNSHMGKKNTTYRFTNSAVETKYSKIFTPV